MPPPPRGLGPGPPLQVQKFPELVSRPGWHHQQRSSPAPRSSVASREHKGRLWRATGGKRPVERRAGCRRDEGRQASTAGEPHRLRSLRCARHAQLQLNDNGDSMKNNGPVLILFVEFQFQSYPHPGEVWGRPSLLGRTPAHAHWRVRNQIMGEIRSARLVVQG